MPKCKFTAELRGQENQIFTHLKYFIPNEFPSFSFKFGSKLVDSEKVSLISCNFIDLRPGHWKGPSEEIW